MNAFPVDLFVVLGGDLVKSTEHLGVAYLAAVLRKHDYDVQIHEIRLSSDLDRILPMLVQKNSRLIGFSTTCINIKQVIELTETIKQRMPDAHIVYGGHMATFTDYSMVEEVPLLDSLIRGEGEETMLELAESLRNGAGLAGIKGLTYRDSGSGRIIQNESRPLIMDLDALPFPSRDQFEMNRGKLQYIRICGSRGCYGTCSYCSNFVGRTQEGPRWRGRSPKNVVDEIEYLVKKYDFHTFDFIDSTFEDPPREGKERIAEIAREIIRRGLKIYYNCCFRAEDWTEADHELLDLLVESGLEKINIGLEAGNDKGLKLFSKKARTRDNKMALQVIKQHPEIYITFGFIYYHSYQQFEDLKDNAVFLHQTGIGQVTRHYLWPLEIYPSTPIRAMLIHDGLMDEGKIIDDIYSYRFVNEEVGNLTKRIVKYLELDIIWDFEIFDIIIHTYITRLKRENKHDPEASAQIQNFWDFVNRKRQEITDVNYQFIMQWITAAEEGWREEDVRQAEALDIENFLIAKKREIQNEQLKLSKQMYHVGTFLMGR